MADLRALADPKIGQVNHRHGDTRAVNLTQLRALAKRLKTDHDLARALWSTGDSAARLLATLVGRPKSFERAELDSMLRGANTPRSRTG